MLFFWVAFLAFVVLLLALDLGVFHKSDRAIGVREALAWTGVSIGYSLAFCGVVYLIYENGWGGVGQVIAGGITGREAVMEYLTGYVIEKSLSIDNVFVMAAIFAYFDIPDRYQHRVLFWGIFGAILLRGIFILTGISLIHHFHWIFYVFGGILVLSALRMLLRKGENKVALNTGTLVYVLDKLIPVEPSVEGHSFLVKVEGRWRATPLLLALLVIEFSDVIFAVDSIPAIFAVTQDPFIVFTSNIMAVLGLRSLYFAVSAMLRKFEHLRFAIAFILAFVGVKMLISDWVSIPSSVSLLVILGALSLGIFISAAADYRKSG